MSFFVIIYVLFCTFKLFITPSIQLTISRLTLLPIDIYMYAPMVFSNIGKVAIIDIFKQPPSCDKCDRH